MIINTKCSLIQYALNHYQDKTSNSDITAITDSEVTRGGTYCMTVNSQPKQVTQQPDHCQHHQLLS